MSRVPVLPTAIVALACAIMVALGIWQLSRADEKAALIARFEAARGYSQLVPFPREEAALDEALFRRSSVECLRVVETRSTASRDLNDTSGIAQIARCELGGGGQADVYLGWTQRPQPVDYRGGETITGWVAPSTRDAARLVADPPAFGLSQLPPPDPQALPNNHLAYAGQWFFFALTALGIYALVLRKRWREGG